MNDTKKLDVETCIDRLKEIVLDALVEPKRKEEWLGPSKIRYATGIDHHLIAANPQKNFKNFLHAHFFLN